MKVDTRLAFGVVVLTTLFLIPEVASATTAAAGGQSSDIYASKALLEEASKIQGWIFGAPVRIAGILAGGYGLFNSILTSSIRPMVVYGALGLVSNVIPKFIDSVFVGSGMLISQFLGG